MIQADHVTRQSLGELSLQGRFPAWGGEKGKGLDLFTKKGKKQRLFYAGVMSRDPGLMGERCGPWLAKAFFEKAFVPVLVSFKDSRFKVCVWY